MGINRIEVRPEMVRWARERSGLSREVLTKSFPKFPAWELGEAQPTLLQLESFAKATHVPFGYLFLPEPPVEPVPIHDFRSIRAGSGSDISPNLRDTIYAMQRRQDWLRDELEDAGAEPLGFVGSARTSDDPEAIGREMRRVVGIADGWAATVRTWQEAVSNLRSSIEQLGVMAVINGVVGNNTRRKLDVSEFRGFALVDDIAPLIFVNGADAKSAQMFTLAHELAHLWLGSVGEGISGFDGLLAAGNPVESFCDSAAAEFLVPARDLATSWRRVKTHDAPFEALAREFKVSPIVVGRRAMDLGLIERRAFFAFYEKYTARERRSQAQSSGGNFYNNQTARIGPAFATYVIRAAKEGRLGFKRAYELTGLNGGAFQKYASRLGLELP